MQRDALEAANLPDEPGVYFFKKGRRILYIGKATSLKDRVRSYFSKDLAHARTPAIARMVQEADRVEYNQCESVLEALFLEANLIKKHLPKYNVDEKDNKSFNNVIITREKYPRVLVVRGREMHSSWAPRDIKYTYGPFPGGLALQEAMKMVRRIFPFRDNKCTPCGSPKNESCKPCFNRQIGLCPGVCTGEMSAAHYLQTIRSIRELFSGNFKGLKRRLATAMKEASQSERFEEAAEIRRQIDALTHIRDVSLIKADLRTSSGGWRGSTGENTRIEAYDVAHTAGEQTVAVMTVIEEGEPARSQYRKFIIRTAKNDDVAALKEALSRRLSHTEWALPRIFVVDGSKAQMNTARKALAEAGVLVPIVGVVKNESHRPRGLLGDERSIRAHEREILLANSEAHRYAIAFHRKRLRSRISRV